MKYLLKNINLLNLILLTAIVLWTYHFVMPSLKNDIDYALPSAGEIVEGKVEASTEKQNPSFTEYLIIAEKNPFHPERTIPVEKKEEKPLPKPEIVLYGTIVTKDLSLAYIEDKNSPVTSPGRGKRVRVLKKGDEINGFVLKEIKPDKIVMVRGEERITVNLLSPSKKRELPAVQPVSKPKAPQAD
ncbi:MAG: hypothetical protein C4560_03615 [Nitrospiraceae bacterium]|nr:MAG: hypothetical protein C4560_03615 [Nitrospiraceae bacterium]